MLAILSNTIENADRLSENLQHYWSTQGVYKFIALYETQSELLAAMASHSYAGVILDEIDNPLGIIPKIRAVCPHCKIAVVTSNKDAEKDNQIAIACYRLNVDMMLSYREFEQPLEKLSKQLCVL